MRHALRGRLLYLWTLELLNALFVFPAVYAMAAVRFRLGWYSHAALGLVCVLLVVGALYWYLKWRSLRRGYRLAATPARGFFRACKAILGAALAGLALLGAARSTGRAAATSEMVVGGLLTIMAALEYINYYYWQLSYDTPAELRALLRRRRPKRATMVRDLGI